MDELNYTKTSCTYNYLCYNDIMFEDCLYFNSNALARTVSKIWIRAYKRFDLSPPHAFLLRLVLGEPGIQPRELADALQLNRSTVTRFLDSLEKKGFVTRQFGERDGREVSVYPTQKAEKIHQQLYQTRDELRQKMKNLMGEQELAKEIEKLRTMREKLTDI